MAIFSPGLRRVEEPREKGLKTGALGLVSSVVMGVASTAPAYSLAATLFFVVAAVGLKSPLVAVLAFVPMLPGRFLTPGASSCTAANTVPLLAPTSK